MAVTAGYVCPEPRAEFYRYMDAANVDLKAFSEDFYHKICKGSLEPVLETLRYLRHETEVWLEITNLLIPGENDEDAEIDAMTRWIVDELGPDVPMHFTAFHPDFRMLEHRATPPATLMRAREIAMANGVRYAYTGNIHDPGGQSTWCPSCDQLLIGRDGYLLGEWNLDTEGACTHCGTPCAGIFEGVPGQWGARRRPVRLAE